MSRQMPKRITRVRLIAEAFGGASCLSIALGLDKSLVTRWDKPKGEGGFDGHVPVYLNASVLEAADRCGVPRDKIIPHLDTGECPCCSQFLHPGVYKNPAFIDAMVRVSRLWGIEENDIVVYDGAEASRE